MDIKKVGLFLKEIREAKGLSVDDVAAKLGCFSMEITYWESGYNLPATNLLLPLSDLYEVSVDEILKAEFENLEAAKEPPVSTKKESEQAEIANNTPQYDYMREILADVQDIPKGEEKPPEKVRAKVQAPAYSFREEVNKRRSENGTAETYENLNGFSNFEIKFGYVICAIFLVLLVIITSVKIGGRVKGFSLDNYEKYISVRLVPLQTFNNTQYEVRVTANENIRNLDMEVRVTFSGYMFDESKEDIIFTVFINESNIKQDETCARRTPDVDFLYTSKRLQVIDVKGDLI